MAKFPAKVNICSHTYALIGIWFGNKNASPDSDILPISISNPDA